MSTKTVALALAGIALVTAVTIAAVLFLKRSPTAPIAAVTLPAAVATDLLQPADFDANSVSEKGGWHVVDGILFSGLHRRDVLQLPYYPPEEYDFRIEFCRIEGNGPVIMILPKNDTRFSFVMDGYSNHSFGFEKINNANADVGPASTRVGEGLVNGKHYVAVVRVRNDGVTAELEAKPIVSWKTSYQDMRSNAAQPDPKKLTLRTWDAAVAFYKIQVVDVKGAGKRTGKPAEDALTPQP